MAYFSTYPKTIINNRLITDLTARVAIRERYTDKLSIYYPYELQEGDTAEIIAAKYYGDPERHWIVMLANDIINPFFDFSLDYQVFNKHINDKYKNVANSVNQWANSNWRGEWTNNEFIVINGQQYSEKDGAVVNYSPDGGIEYVTDPETGITYSYVENGPDDIDVFTEYAVDDIVTKSNTAFICIKSHVAKNFDAQKSNWSRILDGVYWKGDWQNDTVYKIDDVVKHNSTIYICQQDNTSNSLNGISYSNADYWRTYSDGIEYASVTNYGYRAITSLYDADTDQTTTEIFYIDKKAYIGQYDDDSLNYASEVKQSENMTLTIDKEKISIFQYEQETNEDKRQVKLIRKEYVQQLEQELSILMETYYG